MIHTNELMLGNWVELKGLPSKVTVIGSKMVFLNGRGLAHSDDSIEGIPITEELLEKCGFNMKKWIDANNVIVDKFPNGYALLIYSRRIEGLNFLHDLQNAYFMLTKKHLEVKL